MDNEFMAFLGSNVILLGAASAVLSVISSGIQGNEATTSRATKLVCRILDSIGQTLMALAIIGMLFGKR